MASNAKGNKKKGRTTTVVTNTEPMDSDSVSVSNHGDHRPNEETEQNTICHSSSTDPPPPNSTAPDNVEMETASATVETDPKLLVLPVLFNHYTSATPQFVSEFNNSILCYMKIGNEDGVDPRRFI